MKWQIKKLVPYFATALLVSISQLSAQNCGIRYDGCGLPLCVDYDNCRWSFNADILYWKALGSNITYNSEYFEGFKEEKCNEFEIEAGQELETNITGVSLLERRTKNKNVRFDHDLGFRLGLNYKSRCSCWDFGFDWTHYHSDARGKDSPIKKGILCLIEQKFDYEIHAHWHLHLDYGDIGVSREFCIDDCLAVTPFFGIRWARIKQDYDSEAFFEFEGEDCFTTVAYIEFPNEFNLLIQQDLEAFFDDTFKIKETHRFGGAGPKIGVDLNWSLGSCLSLFGSAGFSYLFGYSKHNVKDHFKVMDELIESVTQSEITNETIGQSISIEYAALYEDKLCFERDLNVQANRPATDLMIGLRYVPVVNCCPYLFSFQFAFEHHAFYGQKHAFFNDIQNRLRDCTSTLAVYGISFSVNLSY